ncbi:hypothetical protein O6H91_Y566800 [Diphasiastrum complanatum]|nr:hypothetical protein O6H91_Y566800 [Diphasiastrum complanatum]
MRGRAPCMRGSLFKESLLPQNIRYFISCDPAFYCGVIIRDNRMVCVACLLPLFLIPLLNILPKLLDLLMARLYAAVGWEYKAPVRVPASCPYKSDSSSVAKMSHDLHTAAEVAKEQNGVNSKVG